MSSTTTTARGTVQLNHPNPQHSTTPPYRSLFLRGYNNLKVPIVRCQSAILSTKQFLQGHDRSSSCSTLQDQSTRGNRDVQSGNIKHIVYPRSYPSHTGSIHPFFPITPSSESWPNTPMSHGCRTLGQDLVDTDSRMRHAPQLPPVQSISYDSKKVICELEQLAASVRDSSRAYNGRRPSHTSCPSNLARTGSTTPSLRSDSPSYAAPDRSRAFTSTSQSGVVGMNTVAPTKERRKHAYANDLSMEEQDDLHDMSRPCLESGVCAVALVDATVHADPWDTSPESNIEWAVIHMNADRARRRRHRGLVVMNPDPEPEHSHGS